MKRRLMTQKDQKSLWVRRFVVAQTPHVRRDRRHLTRRKLRATLRRHRAAILLRLRHAILNRFSDARITAVAPQPFLACQIRSRRRALAAIAMASGASRAAHLAAINALTELHHL